MTGMIRTRKAAPTCNGEKVHFQATKINRTIKHNNPKPLKVDLESAGCKLATHVYCGGFSSYVISGEGKVFAWGENTHGQLGLMNEEEEKAWIQKEETEKRMAKRKSWKPVKTKSNDEDEDSDKVDRSKKDEAATKVEEKIIDEEGNEVKVKPLKVLTTQRVPRLVRKLNKQMIKSLAVGHRHVLALTKGGGVVYSWGFNKYGQLGTMDTVNQSLPKRVTSLRGAVVVDVACGRHFSLQLPQLIMQLPGKSPCPKSKEGEAKVTPSANMGENANGQCAAGHYKSPVLKPHTVIPCASWGEKDGGPKTCKYWSCSGCFHSLFRDDRGVL